MNSVMLIVITVIVVLIIIYKIRLNKIKDAEKRYKEEMDHQANQKVTAPERKLHEEEKKRWENDYYKQH